MADVKRQDPLLSFPFQTPIGKSKRKDTVHPWTAEEHKLFQVALEKFSVTPSSNVWQQIAAHISTRT